MADARPGAGWLQIVSDFEDPRRRSACSAGWRGIRPAGDDHRCCSRDVRPERLAHADGGDRRGQREGLRDHRPGRSRPTSVLLGFELSQNPFMGRPSYRAIAHLPFAERLAAAAQPEFRARLLAEAFEGSRREPRVERWDRMFPLGDPPDYEPTPETQHRRARGARRAGAGGGGLRPAAARRRRQACSICRSPTMPTATSTWCAR